MATLTVTNQYISGTLAKASEVNQNFTDVINLINGNIQNDNLGTMSGEVTWNITTSLKAIEITNAGGETSIEVTQSAAPDPNKAIVLIDDNSSPSSNTLAFQVDSTSRGAAMPRMTTVQRDAISDAPEGSLIYNTDSTSKQYQFFNGTDWVNTALPAGTIIDFAGTALPDGYLFCDGSAISALIFVALFNNIGTTYGVGSGPDEFNLPDLRGRSSSGVDNMNNTVGTGGGNVGRITSAGSGINAIFLNASGGTETYALTSTELAAHNHPITDPGHLHSITDQQHGHTIQTTKDDFATGNFFAGAADATPNQASELSFTGITTTNSGSTGITGTNNNLNAGDAHQNMPPTLILNKLIKT